MIDAAEAVRRITATGAPVLCLDTCALLDLMRDPTRDKFGGGHAAAGLALLARAEMTPPTLSLIIAEQVGTELADHMDRIQTESEQVLRRLDATMNRACDVLAAYGLVPSPAGPNLSSLNFPIAARAIVERFIRVAHTVQEEESFLTRAWARVRAGTAPAARGKQSIKDCVVVETYLHVARALRSGGFAGKILFLTTNTADYAEGARPQLHSGLVADFTGPQLTFATDFLMARYAL